MVGRVVPLAASEQALADAAAAFLASRAWPDPPIAAMSRPSPGWSASLAVTGRVDAHRRGVTVVMTAWGGRAPAT